jgi:hypothetical protein
MKEISKVAVVMMKKKRTKNNKIMIINKIIRMIKPRRKKIARVKMNDERNRITNGALREVYDGAGSKYL